MANKILIIRLGSLGDIILTSPAVINLKIKYPDSRISFLCKEKFRPVVELIDGVDEIITLPDNASLATFGRLLLSLDDKNYDIVLDLHGNLRSWMARKVISSSNTIVYPKRRYERIVAVKQKVIPKVWPHTIDLYNDAVEQAGARPYCARPIMSVPEVEHDEAVSHFIDTYEQRFVVIAPGAAHPNKQWPLEKFNDTALKLHEMLNVGIVWAITAEDANKISPANRIKDDTFIELVDYPLQKLLSLISHGTLTIANDSGIAHASSAVGTPVIAIFGPTHQSLGFAPKGIHDRVVEVDEFCRPCSLHGKKPCYRDSRHCFDRITVSDVIRVADDVLFDVKNRFPAAFVDRDGTIIIDKHFLSDPEGVEFEPGSLEAMKRLSDEGYKIIIISNQSGVARGYFDTDTVEMVNGRLMELLSARDIEVDGFYYCPHYPQGTVQQYAVSCRCRKPGPKMAETAVYQLGVDLRNSFVIGDKVDDVNLAKVIGATPVMVGTGYGKVQRECIDGNPFYNDVSFVDNLEQAVSKMIGKKANDKDRPVF